MQRMREKREHEKQIRETVKISQQLLDAAERGQWQVVTDLVAEHGKDDAIINAEREIASAISGPTALYLAALNERIETVKALLVAPALRPNGVNYADQMNTPLLAAARAGHDKIVIAIAEHPKTNWNAKNDAGIGVLTYAIYNCAQVMPFLLQGERADVNIADRDGRTPLMHAIINPDPAWRNIVSEPVALLLAKPQLMVDARDKKGWTALMYAAQKGNAAVVAALLDKHANPALTSFDIKTAAAIAVQFKHPDIAALIEQHQLRAAAPQEQVVAADPAPAAETAPAKAAHSHAGNRFPHFFAEKKRDLSKEMSDRQSTPDCSP